MPAEQDDQQDDDQQRAAVGTPEAAVPIVVIGVLVTTAVVFAYRSSALSALAFGIVMAVSVRLSVIDVREHRLPNRIVGPLAIVVAAGVVIAGLAEADLARSWRALALGAAVTAVLLVVNVVGGLGMGDVKYGFPMAATVGWYGWDALVLALMVTTLSGGIVAGVVLLLGKGKGRQLPYGPFMALGLAIGLLVAAPW